MRHPKVFKSKTTGDWVLWYRPGQTDRYHSHREALDHALTWARVRHVADVTMKELP